MSPRIAGLPVFGFNTGDDPHFNPHFGKERKRLHQLGRKALNADSTLIAVSKPTYESAFQQRAKQADAKAYLCSIGVGSFISAPHRIYGYYYTPL